MQSSSRPPQQGANTLNCPSLSGLSVLTEGSGENAYLVRDSEEHADHFASSKPQEDQSQYLDTWSPFDFEEPLHQSGQKSATSSLPDSCSALFPNRRQPHDSWAACPSTFAVSYGSEKDDRLTSDAVQSHAFNQAGGLTHPFCAQAGSQGPMEISSGVERFVTRPTTDIKASQNYHCHQSSSDLLTSLPPCTTDTGQADKDVALWPTCYVDTAIGLDMMTKDDLTDSKMPFTSWNTTMSQSPQTGNQVELENSILLNSGQTYTQEEEWAQLSSSAEQYDMQAIVPNVASWDGEDTSMMSQTYEPRLIESDRLQFDSSLVTSLTFKDDYLVQQKRAGMTYKEIKEKGQFTEAESTLRGRYRNLTKRKEERVRKPEWTDRDVSLPV